MPSFAVNLGGKASANLQGESILSAADVEKSESGRVQQMQQINFVTAT